LKLIFPRVLPFSGQAVFSSLSIGFVKYHHPEKNPDSEGPALTHPLQATLLDTGADDKLKGIRVFYPHMTVSSIDLFEWLY
jgi:hypothetical protein